MKKVKGFTETSEVIIAVATLFLAATFILYQQFPIKTKWEAESEARKAMYKVEEIGYLPQERQQELEKKLTELGCKNIRISATSTKVDYGQDIDLNIEYDTTIKVIKVDDTFFPTLEDKDLPVKIPKSTVSKATP